MTLLLAGATGLVGSRVLALAQRLGQRVVPVGRTATGTPGEVVAPLTALPKGQLRLPRASIAICALGTTRAKAGSDAAFRAVDYDAVLAFAAAAQAAGVKHFILVSSMGANAGSRLLYPRTKGEVEAALGSQGFARLDILQPGLILGPRAERRPVEALLQRLAPTLDLFLFGPLADYGAVPATTVAATALGLAGETAPGLFRHRNGDMVVRAGALYRGAGG